MAIPFYEDEPVAAAANIDASQLADGDQVDGPTYVTGIGIGTDTDTDTNTGTGTDQVDYEGPSSTTATSNSDTTSTDSQMPPSTEEQLLVWKMLALAMCKVLKQFYMQHKNQQQQPGKSTKLTATVQIQPQAQ